MQYQSGCVSRFTKRDEGSMMIVGKGKDSGVVKVRVRALTSISIDQGSL
jgi:hypothetical protein